MDDTRTGGSAVPAPRQPSPPHPTGKSTRRARLPSLQVRDAERHMGGRPVQPASPPRGARLPLSAAVTSQSSPASGPHDTASRAAEAHVSNRTRGPEASPSTCPLPSAPRPSTAPATGKNPTEPAAPPALGPAPSCLLELVTLIYYAIFFLSPEAFTGGQGTGFLVGGVECHSAFCTEEFF